MNLREKGIDKGITLVSLVVTIIVSMVLIGISLKILDNTGIILKAETAVSETEKAKMLESKQMSESSLLMKMYASGEGNKSISQYISDELDNPANNGKLETDNGVYEKENDGTITYTDKNLKDKKIILVKDRNGELIEKAIVTEDGDEVLEDLTTPETLKTETEASIEEIVAVDTGYHLRLVMVAQEILCIIFVMMVMLILVTITKATYLFVL